jgi:small subunit ribosomal protein S14
MAKLTWEIKAAGPAKFSSQKYNRCKNCGRRRAYIRRFQICRICFRELASQGKIPGVVKASW